MPQCGSLYSCHSSSVFTKPADRNMRWLCVLKVDICLYRIHALLLRELQHLADAPPPDVPVLERFANDDRQLAAAAQGDISDQYALIFDAASRRAC